MPLTMDILEYQLSFSRKILKNRKPDKQELCMARFWTEGETQKNVLYLIRPEEFNQYAFPAEGLHFLCPSPPERTADCDILYPAEAESPIALFNDVQEIFWQHSQWKQKIQEILGLTDCLTRALELSAEYMRVYLALVSNDYTIIGSAGERTYKIPSVVENGQKMSFSSVTSLEQESDYSHVLEFHHFFEYPTINSDQRVLCFNIFLEGQYFARLLGNMPLGRPCDGAGHLLEEFGGMLEQYYTKNRRTALNRETREEMEGTLRTLLSGKNIELTTTRQTLALYNWLPEHCYQVVRIEFLLDVSLDYYRFQLEKLFPGSVTLILENALYCVRNGILSPDTGQNDESFPAFIRDGLCKAGFSTLATNIFQLHYRRLEADSALRLGKQRNETLWYFHFSDLILDFIAEVIREKLPATSLLHPAIRTLQDYDQQNNGDLTATLHQYLLSQGHSTQAAEALCIHRTTFIHRINRIQELTGLCLDDSKERLHLELSFYFLNQEEQT